MKKTHKFPDHVVWITGASSGIGRALALAFAREGAKIALSARRKDFTQWASSIQRPI